MGVDLKIRDLGQDKDFANRYIHLQLAISRVQVCSSRGKRARCIGHAHVIEILKEGHV